MKEEIVQRRIVMRQCIFCRGKKFFSISPKLADKEVDIRQICAVCWGKGGIEYSTPLELFKYNKMRNFCLAIGWKLGYMGNENNPELIFPTEEAIDQAISGKVSRGGQRDWYIKTEILVLTDGENYIVVSNGDSDICTFESV